MALFGSYAPPDVYTSIVIDNGGIPLFGNARIPVLIGEGLEYFTQQNEELHRGSSAVADDQVVNEIISDQVLPIVGNNHTYRTTYFPIVDGSGQGVVTNDVTKITVTDNGVPLTVIALNGAAGTFMVQELVTPGDQVEVSYFFKKTDTLVSLEDLSADVPSFAAATLPLNPGFSITLTNPGVLGNLVSVALTLATSGGKNDSQAVSGAGTDTISVELLSPTGVRTLAQLKDILEGIQTKSAGAIVVTLNSAHAADAGVATTAPVTLAGGNGPSNNVTFTVANYPIVDGTNGGVVTTNPKYITVLVNGDPVTVTSLDGQSGTFTLASPVSYGSTLTVTYYTNTYQNTSDMLPSSGVSSVIQVGLGPDRADFVEGIDYVLSTDQNGNSTINWGASFALLSGNVTGTVQLAAATTAKLVDEQVYLRPAVGVCNGKNAVFGLEYTPVDGSGRNVTTNNPKLIKVYVGADVATALASPVQYPVSVAGAQQQITLYNPPQTGQKVFVSYYRNTIADQTYTLAVGNSNLPGQGTYKVSDSFGNKLPTVASTFAVADTAFPAAQLADMVGLDDLAAKFGAASEDVSITFDQTDSSTTSGAQATLVIGGLTFLAYPGTGISANGITVSFDTTAPTGVVNSGTTLTIGGAGQTTDSVAALLGSSVVVNGVTIGVSGSGSTQIGITSGQLDGGTASVTTTQVVGFTVASTGKSAGVGYLGQTYIDAQTGLKFTLAVPDGWAYATTDVLGLVVNSNGAFVTGTSWNVAIPGVQVKVASTLLMNTGDTATLSTFNKSGDEPAVGEYYYASYTVPKTATDMAITMYNDPTVAYTAYGQPTAVNRVSLGVKLLTDNGAQTFAVIQVPKQPGLNTAADADFTAAIQSLTSALPSTDRKADVIVPISNSMPVIQFLSRFLITQATARNKGEAMAFVGFAAGTDATTLRSYARSLLNSRVVAVANPQAGILATDPRTNLSVEYAVSGEFMAAALAGLNCNPSNDVAQTLTTQSLVGFSRLFTAYDEPTMNQMAADGLTVLTNNNGALNIRHYKSTDPTDAITSEPTSTTVADYVRQQFRIDLKQFISRKLIDGLVTDITAVCVSRLRSLINNEIITTYSNLSVTPDAVDPNTVNVSVSFKPMFCLLWISVTFTVTLANS